jgi:hypothetical protein
MSENTIYLKGNDQLDISILPVGLVAFLNGDILGVISSMDMKHTLCTTEISYTKVIKEGEPLVSGKIIVQHHPREKEIHG